MKADSVSVLRVPPRRSLRENQPRLAALLFAAGCFLSQSFLLPYFGWSFLLLLAVFILTESYRLDSLKQMFRFNWAEVLLFVSSILYLSWLIGTATRISSVAYFLSSMMCAFFVGAIHRRCPELVYLAIRYFLATNLILVIIGIIEFGLFYELNSFFMGSEKLDYLRFRGLSLEPNHLGFSLNAIYALVLFPPLGRIRWRRDEFFLTVGVIWTLAALTLSLFTLPVMAFTTVLYGWTTTNRKIKSVVFVLVVALLYISSGRFEQMISGADNSANLRTWVSLVVAKGQIDRCGPSGCGLGNAPVVLEDEPMMADFAADRGLPNLFASAMVEGGYFFVIFFLMLILFSSTPIGRRRFGINMRSCVARFSLLFLCAASGSFPYDAQFWSILGLFFAVIRTNASSDSSRPYSPELAT